MRRPSGPRAVNTTRVPTRGGKSADSTLTWFVGGERAGIAPGMSSWNAQTCSSDAAIGVSNVSVGMGRHPARSEGSGVFAGAGVAEEARSFAAIRMIERRRSRQRSFGVPAFDLVLVVL